ncbi:hypothetical protein HanXRQr2_Chr04g0167651 [Helianthus annuus]|uniref:Uncharacterized protein n=1 Tax=Helianthus annuus TaxID=4232 RepID=A0A9K3J8H8_HELAN|nr:hypothetical protein HanXRQr2_Chr04g0167651 [Helianthus annuus]KAJ0931405.1 hypothetical protein HanPSC8_Chr04g0161281 [Helianthus annuus]
MKCGVCFSEIVLAKSTSHTLGLTLQRYYITLLITFNYLLVTQWAGRRLSS